MLPPFSTQHQPSFKRFLTQINIKGKIVKLKTLYNIVFESVSGGWQKKMLRKPSLSPFRTFLSRFFRFFFFFFFFCQKRFLFYIFILLHSCKTTAFLKEKLWKKKTNKQKSERPRQKKVCKVSKKKKPANVQKKIVCKNHRKHIRNSNLTFPTEEKKEKKK